MFFFPPRKNTTTGVSIVITDPGLGLSSAGFHIFVATKTFSGPMSDTFSFSIPFKMMLNAKATFYFSPSNNVTGVRIPGERLRTMREISFGSKWCLLQFLAADGAGILSSRPHAVTHRGCRGANRGV
jgi:hypothetical protein